MMFNNNESQGRQSMISNNLLSGLVSPPQLNDNRKLQYSSQITGKMLDMQGIDEERKSATDDVLQSLGKKSSKKAEVSEKESSENGQYDMQEINISLESADVEEPLSGEVVQRKMPGTSSLARSPPKQSFEKKPIDTSVSSPIVSFAGNNEEEFKSEVASE